MQGRLNLRKYPYRGVISELAREEGVSRVAIWKAIFKHRNPRIIVRFMDKLKERELRDAFIERLSKTGKLNDEHIDELVQLLKK